MTPEIITAQSPEGPWQAYQEGTLSGSESDTVGRGDTEEEAIENLKWKLEGR